ncbi:MAG: ParB/RepB/Spo0J family partition protein [Candidatus Yanofskybacteria bacterium]|nr:ParB/RepB/Spo0J family partition protein [Candidatus Yanofskybacteria bacterium]
MSKKLFGLGKGLSSLIPDEVAEGVNQKRENVFYVEVSKIQPNPEQPRTDFDQGALTELSRSIRKFGVLQPLLVSKIEEDLPRGRAVKYQLIAGERRWRAAQMAGLPQVPVIIRDDLAPGGSSQPSQRLEVALIENIQREDLNAIEQAEAYTRLAGEFGLTQQEIAEKVGKSREAVANIMRLMNLPKYIKDATRAGSISGTAARALLSFQDEAAQRQAYEQLTAGGFSTKDVEYAASAAKAAVGRRKASHSARFEELRVNLAEHLQAPVLIRTATGSAKAGQIVIRFTDLEHLNGVVKRIID